MRPVLCWIDKVQEESGGGGGGGGDNGCCVYDLAWKPDGSELLVAADTNVLLYDGQEGTLLQALKGHKDLVFCVSWAFDGERFASAGLDKTVILWTAQHEGTLKYTLVDAIQCLAFSPCAPVLLSCGQTEFGLWSADDKAVQRQKVSSRCTCCAWSSDGQFYAIGAWDGSVSIRKAGSLVTQQQPYSRIQLPSNEPITAIHFSGPLYTSQTAANSAGNGGGVGGGGGGANDRGASMGNGGVDEPGGTETSSVSLDEVLAVTDCSRSLSFFDINGNRIVRADRHLDYEPTFLEYFNGGQFLVCGGSRSSVHLYTRLGTPLGTVAELDTWVWCARVRPASHTVVAGCVDGTLVCYQLVFSTVHGLHKHRYAYRDSNQVDVVVQHLGAQLSCRIHCGQLVRKVAVYQQRLAVQLVDRVHIYRQVSGDKEGEPLEYRLVDRINHTFDCTLLVVCAQHIILCQERLLQSYDQKGLRQREWVFDSHIRYIKVIGGPPARETIMVGLKNGVVCRIYLNNPFPVQVVQLNAPIRCVDVSVRRHLLAVTDDHGLCQVFDTNTKQVVFQEGRANSVALNTENDQLVCWSGGGQLHVRSLSKDHSTTASQPMQGFVVGFSGSRVYCLHMFTMRAVAVPLSTHLYKYIEARDWGNALLIAGLGVSESDWRVLGYEAMYAMRLDVAARAFQRTRDFRWLHFVCALQAELTASLVAEPEARARLFAAMGSWREAVGQLTAIGQQSIAMSMLSEMKMFDEAALLLGGGGGGGGGGALSRSMPADRELIRKRADWAAAAQDPRTAATLLISSADWTAAVRLVCQHDLHDVAVTLLHKVPRTDVDLLHELAKLFIRRRDFGLAARVFQQTGDKRRLIQMYVDAEQWNEALAAVTRLPQFHELVYVPYAQWLAERDRFEEAQQAFHKAGRSADAVLVVQQLCESAVNQQRWADASRCCWLLSRQFLERAAASSLPRERARLLDEHEKTARLADVYHAYNSIFLYAKELFTDESAETMLHAARWLAYGVPQLPTGVSRLVVLMSLCRVAEQSACWKLARDSSQSLLQLRRPTASARSLDVHALRLRAHPLLDPSHLLPVCYRCGLANSLTEPLLCTHCRTAFVYCARSWDVLPVVEFFLADGLDENEAIQLVEAEPPASRSAIDPLAMGGPPKSGTSGRLVFGRETLAELDSTVVFMARWPAPLATRFYLHVMPSIPISQCSTCFKLFHMDDFELAKLTKGACPFCRTPASAASSGAAARNQRSDSIDEPNSSLN